MMAALLQSKANLMLYKFRLAIRNEIHEVMSHFGPEKDDEDMFAYLWSLPDAHQHLTPEVPPCKKSKERAKNLIQNTGLLSLTDLYGALRMCNQAVVNAPFPGGEDRTQESRPDQTLGTCYATRSEILFKLGFYDKCLSDIERAIQAGYSRKGEMEKRKKKCLQAMSRESYLPYVKEATRDHRNRPREETFHQRFKLYQQSQLGGFILTENFRKSLLSEAEVPKPKLSDPHPNIPTMSRAVSLAYTPEKGRHIVAARDIYPGELLFLEDNFCSSLYQDSYETRCLTCASQCSASLPCPSCSFVMFCSEECRDLGIAKYHKIECQVLPALAIYSDEAPTALVFRMLMQLTFPRLKELLPLLEEEAKTRPPEKLGFNEEDIFDAADFRTVYHLCTNKDRLSCLSILGTCTVAFIIMKLLITSKKYFVDNNGDPVSPSDEDIALVGGTLVKILMVVDTNSFCLKELQVSCTRNGDILRSSVGMKLCSTLSLLNHSCNPSVYSSTGSGYSSSRAIRFVPAGQEVTTCYGITYCDLEKIDRWERLKSYYFNCRCEACENSWPKESELPTKVQMKCLGCAEPLSCRSGHCTKCQKEDEKNGNGEGTTLTERNKDIGKQVLDAVKAYHQTRNSERFVDRNDEKDREAICKVIELMDRYVVLPCKLYCDAQQALQIYYNREGKFTYVSPGHENLLSNYYWAPL